MKMNRFVLSLFLVIVFFNSSCKKDDDKTTTVVYYYPDYTDIGEGENISIVDEEVSDKVSLEGGALDVSGNSHLGEVELKEKGGVVTADQNSSLHKVNMDNGSLLMSGNSEIRTDFNMDGGNAIITDSASMNILNMDGGVSTISGSAKVKVDLNFNRGTIHFGDSLQQDTVHIGNNFNAADSVWIDWGIVVIGTDFNLNKGAFLSVSDSAKLFVNHNLNGNNGVKIFGGRNIEVKHTTNLNGGKMEEAPFGEKSVNEEKKETLK